MTRKIFNPKAKKYKNKHFDTEKFHKKKYRNRNIRLHKGDITGKHFAYSLFGITLKKRDK